MFTNNNRNPKIEICLDSLESAIAAEKGGADRIELCSDLFEGGITPSIGLVQMVKKSTTIGLQVIIRPRGGDFCYSNYEFETMKQDIQAVKDSGANGVVIGILTPDGNVDSRRTKELIELASPMNVTFHRAFDVTQNPEKALEDIINLGCSRILTSGQESTVLEGMDLIQKLIKQAKGRIIIMPGNGITERNFIRIDSVLEAREYHVYLHKQQACDMVYKSDRVYMGGELRQSEYLIQHTCKNRVRTITGK